MGETHPHPVGPLWAPAKALYAEAETGLARVALALFVAFLEEEEEREWNGRVGMGLVVVRSRGRGCMSRSGFKYGLLWKLYGWYGRRRERCEM